MSSLKSAAQFMSFWCSIACASSFIWTKMVNNSEKNINFEQMYLSTVSLLLFITADSLKVLNYMLELK